MGLTKHSVNYRVLIDNSYILSQLSLFTTEVNTHFDVTKPFRSLILQQLL